MSSGNVRTVRAITGAGNATQVVRIANAKELAKALGGGGGGSGLPAGGNAGDLLASDGNAGGTWVDRDAIVQPIPDATTTQRGLMSAEDKERVDTLWAAPAPVTSVGNPNILINTDFRNPINQRGAWGPANNTYLIDRWKTGYGNDTLSMSPESGCLRVSPSALAPHYIELNQFVENPAAYRGRTLTLSARVRCVNKELCVRVLTGVSQKGVDIKPGDGWKTVIVTIDIPVNATEIRVYLRYRSASGVDPGDWFEIEWIKLEEGPAATPWLVPDPAEELLRCQRYCAVLGGAHSVNYPSLAQGFVQQLSPISVAQFFLPKLNLRRTPGCRISGDFHLYAGSDFSRDLILDANHRLEVAVSPLHCGLCVLYGPANFLPAIGRFISLRSANVNSGRMIFDAEV